MVAAHARAARAVPARANGQIVFAPRFFLRQLAKAPSRRVPWARQPGGAASICPCQERGGVPGSVACFHARVRKSLATFQSPSS